MSGGGGGGGINMPPADNSLQLEAMREAAADRANAQAKQDAADKEAKFQTNLSTAVTGAKATGKDYLGTRGLSSDQYGSVIDSIINDQKARVPSLDPNPGGYFTSDTFESGLNNYQNTQRANLNNKVNNLFTPGFETSMLPDSLSGSVIDSILGDQKTNAQRQIDANRSRGLLNDSGYNVAEQQLGQQAGAGRSTLQSLSDSILGKDRQDLLSFKGNAGSVASNYSLGSPTPDFQPYYNQASEKAGKYSSDLNGSILGALGNTSLFDVPTILQKAGTAQGPQNLTTAASLAGSPFNNDNKNTFTPNRGLGSTGGF